MSATDDSPAEETVGTGVLCPACARPIAERDHFCPVCGVPLTSFAATDPLASIRSEAEMVRRAFQRPTLLKLIGVWMIFGPGALGCLLVVYLSLQDVGPDPTSGRLLQGVFKIIPVLFLGLIPVAILWRMTDSYLSTPDVDGVVQESHEDSVPDDADLNRDGSDSR